MASSVGWRNFYWLNVAILTFAVFAVLVGFPETKWRRPATNEILINTQIPDSPSKDMAIEKQDDSNGSGSGNVNTITEVDLGKSKPSKWQWKLLQPAENPFKSLLVEFLIPWKLLLYPIVIFASLIVAFSSTCYLMVNYVQSEGLAAPPYLFSTQAVGFTNFASLVGALIGLFTAGPASDYVSAALTKRNKGIREPEMRLVTMIPYVLVMILGNFMVGYGFQNSWNWRVSKALYPTIESLTRNAGHCHHWFHLRRHPNRCSSSNRGHLCCRLLQTYIRGHFYIHHLVQEYMGVRRIKVLYPMGAKRGIRSSVYDEYVIDSPLVWLRWYSVLDLGQELPKVDGKEYGAPDVKFGFREIWLPTAAE